MAYQLQLLALALVALLGQAAPRPSFEVATIKRNVSGEGGSAGMEPGGRFRVVNADLRFLIQTMYRVPNGPRLFPSQIIGLPAWASTEKYDMTGKIAAQYAGLPTPDQFRLMAPMVQSLLEDRFKLKLHRDTQALPVYALVVSKPNVLKRSTADCRKNFDACRIQATPGHYSAVGLTLNNFLIFLSGNVDRVVIDKTGLQGSFDVELDYSTDAATSDKPSIFTALQEQLGLKLEFERDPVDVVVIDHVERPTED